MSVARRIMLKVPVTVANALGWIGGAGLLATWIVTWYTLFSDDQPWLGLASLVLTPVLTVVTGWFAGPLVGIAALVSSCLVVPEAVRKDPDQTRDY